LLRGEQGLQLRKQQKEEKKTTKTKGKQTIRPQDQALWQALRKLRSKLAEAAGVPPYVIFHDATLQQMLKERPANKSDMRFISGVGEQKLLRYGKDFLDVIAEHSLPELLDNHFSDTVNETLCLVQEGKNAEQIAAIRGLNVNTIYCHLAEAIEAGQLRDPG
jgi:ATP-dependent DNA helicase RecQ